MESFAETSQAKLTELVGNLTTFQGGNNVAGTRVRKNAQELKQLLQTLRGLVLEEQKGRKEENKNKPKKEKKVKKEKKEKKEDKEE